MVTGAASGIGRQIAQDLADAGAHVIAVDRDAAGLASWDQHPHATALVCDLSDAEATGRAFEGLDEVDYLVNAAGVAIFEPVLELSVETWDVTTAINNRAPVQLTQAFAKQVHAPRGMGLIVEGAVHCEGQPRRRRQYLESILHHRRQ